MKPDAQFHILDRQCAAVDAHTDLPRYHNSITQEQLCAALQAAYERLQALSGHPRP